MIDGMYTSQGAQAALGRAADCMAREKSARGNGRGPVRPPRRAQSTIDYVYPSPARGESWTVFIHQGGSGSASASSTPPASEAPTMATLNSGTHERQPTIAEEVLSGRAGAGTPRPGTPTGFPGPGSTAVMPSNGRSRPKLGPPRRSYTVMDYEPVPHYHRLSDNLTLGDLPAELHYVIFDFLDPIDSTCLGLTSKHFYNIHRRMHGKIPLSVRRSGPNDMEWVWHLASRMKTQPRSGPHKSIGEASDAAKQQAANVEEMTKALAKMRIKGQALCRKCGVSRCELHKHIQGWMGPGYEYCTVREKFGPPPPEGAKEYCYLSNPKDPHRCGRHRVPKSRPSTPRCATPITPGG